jgi:hypothetical protein
VRIAIEWMVDTGADLATVRNATGARFDLTATGGSASPTTGGGGILVYTGITVEFTAEDRRSGAARPMASTQPVGVKSGNTGSEVLGMDALSSNAVDIEWSPSARLGTLWTVSTPAGSAPAAPATATRPEEASSRRAPPGTTPRGITDHGTWVDIGGVRLEKRLWRG